jgi:hypothetical protein
LEFNAWDSQASEMMHLRLNANDMTTCCGKALVQDIEEAHDLLHASHLRAKKMQVRWLPQKFLTDIEVDSALRKCNCRECLAWLVDWLIKRIDQLERRPPRTVPQSRRRTAP